MKVKIKDKAKAWDLEDECAIREEKRQQCRAAAEARRVEERLSDEPSQGSHKRNRSEAEDPLISSSEDAQALQALPDHLHIQVLEDRFTKPSTGLPTEELRKVRAKVTTMGADTIKTPPLSPLQWEPRCKTEKMRATGSKTTPPRPSQREQTHKTLTFSHSIKPTRREQTRKTTIEDIRLISGEARNEWETANNLQQSRQLFWTQHQIQDRPEDLQDHQDHEEISEEAQPEHWTVQALIIDDDATSLQDAIS